MQGRVNNKNKKVQRAAINQAVAAMAMQRAPGGRARQSGPQRRRAPRRRGNRRRTGQRGRRYGFLGSSEQLTAKGVVRNRTTNSRDCVEEQDEYIADITVTNEPNFVNVAYPVNPGQAQTFPWLSRLAVNFEKYEFEFLEFYVKRLVSEYATAGQGGKVILSFDTDASDPAPISKQQMEDTDPHVDAMACQDQVLTLGPKHLHGRDDAWFVRSAGQPANTDIKTYDIGNLNVATSAITANVPVGELHVRYRVRLMTPILESNSGGVGIMTAASPTSASPLLNGVASGGIVVSQALTVVSFTGLQIGQEYMITYLQTSSVNSALTGVGTLVGLTLKNTLYGNEVIDGITATATATSGSVTLSVLNNPATPTIFAIVALPTSSV
jgi:hypothetical protein